MHVPKITCRFTTPHSGPSICQLSSPASAELEQALVLPIDHVSNFEWPGPEVVHQLSWSHGVSTSINHGNRVIPTWSHPQWPGYTNHNGMVQQYPILFCIVVGITRSGVEFRSWISTIARVYWDIRLPNQQTNKPTQVLLRQHTPKGTYPRPSTNPLWFGIPFLLGFVPEAPGISRGSLG